MDRWISSIDDPTTAKAIKDGAFITGGSIASMFLKEDVNDFDIYFRDKQSLKAVLHYYIKKANNGRLVEYTPNMSDYDSVVSANLVGLIDGSYWLVPDSMLGNGSFSRQIRNIESDRLKVFIYEGIRRFDYKPEDETPFRLLCITPNSITLSDKLQIVMRFHGEPDEIHKNYDFVHATNVYDYKNDKLIINQPALESLIMKELKYIGSLYPLTSILRAKKFVSRGWTITAGEHLKIMYQVSALDLSDIDVLEEQLIGVDIAYFQKLIEVLRNIAESKPDFHLTQGYLFELIDRVFSDEYGDN
jgi:hypothetical protein